jgi:hypothetical protein
MRDLDNLESFEEYEGDPAADAVRDITAAVTLWLDRPALLMAQGLGVVFCNMEADTYEYIREHVGARLVSQASLKEDIDLWYDQEFAYSQNPSNPVAELLTRDLNLEDGTVRVQGSALVCGTDAEGGTVPLTPAQVRRLVHWFLERVAGPDELHMARPAVFG